MVRGELIGAVAAGGDALFPDRHLAVQVATDALDGRAKCGRVDCPQIDHA